MQKKRYASTCLVQTFVTSFNLLASVSYNINFIICQKIRKISFYKQNATLQTAYKLQKSHLNS